MFFAFQAQASATQLRLEEANEQLQHVKVQHAQELLEQQEVSMWPAPSVGNRPRREGTES